MALTSKPTARLTATTMTFQTIRCLTTHVIGRGIGPISILYCSSNNNSKAINSNSPQLIQTPLTHRKQDAVDQQITRVNIPGSLGPSHQVCLSPVCTSPSPPPSIRTTLYPPASTLYPPAFLLYTLQTGSISLSLSVPPNYIRSKTLYTPIHCTQYTLCVFLLRSLCTVHSASATAFDLRTVQRSICVQYSHTRNTALYAKYSTVVTVGVQT